MPQNKQVAEFLLVFRSALTRSFLLGIMFIGSHLLSSGFFALVAPHSSLAAISSAAENREQAQQQLAVVGGAIEEIQDWLLAAHATQSDEETRLQDAEEEIADVSQSIQDSQSDLNRTESQLELLHGQHAELESNKSQQSKVLAQLLRAAYMAGEQSPIKLLLSQQDIAKTERMLHYSRVFSESQLEKIAEFQHTLDEIAEVNSQLQSKATDLNAQQDQLQQKMLALNEAKAVRESALLNLKASISSRGSELEQLEINQAQLQQLIEQINLAMQQIPAAAEQIPFAQQRGKLPMPVEGPIISRFGSRYGESDLKTQGLSIAVSEGTLVQAVHAGRIVFSDWLRGTGLLVIVDHGDGYMSLYGANQALSRQAGEWVESGDILATSGRVSNQSTDSIYFEIRLHGEAQNPSSWLESAN